MRLRGDHAQKRAKARQLFDPKLSRSKALHSRATVGETQITSLRGPANKKVDERGIKNTGAEQRTRSSAQYAANDLASPGN
jgi:hypothetical protein